jgi:hypothetical protein
VPNGALAGSLTSPGHLFRENELSTEEIKMMQFSSKKQEEIRFLRKNKVILKDDVII